MWTTLSRKDILSFILKEVMQIRKRKENTRNLDGDKEKRHKKGWVQCQDHPKTPPQSSFLDSNLMSRVTDYLPFENLLIGAATLNWKKEEGCRHCEAGCPLWLWPALLINYWPMAWPEPLPCALSPQIASTLIYHPLLFVLCQPRYQLQAIGHCQH